MAKFSERNYYSPSSVLIREQMPKEVVNAICSCYDIAIQTWYGYGKLEQHLWRKVLNKRLRDFYDENGTPSIVATKCLESIEYTWYQKLDLIEETLLYLSNYTSIGSWHEEFTDELNSEFRRLNYAYRIIDNKIVEITSEEEIASIEEASQNPSNGVKEHIHTALELLSKRPEGDYRNSIKESISAVEAVVREITGESSFDLTKLEKKVGAINPQLRQAFQNLFNYTNDKSTGIRHAQMEDTHAPGADEAIFMLVSCSAFINYLTKKRV